VSKRSPHLLLASLLLGVALAAGNEPAISQSGLPSAILVTKTADTNDGFCEPTDCSLREAVQEANANAGQSGIRIPSGVYNLSLGRLNVTAPLNIVGANPRTTIVDANETDVIFFGNAASVGLTMSGLTLRDGNGQFSGGALGNFTPLTLSNMNFVSNSAGQRGGAIATLGNTTIRDSTFRANTALSRGAAVYVQGGSSLTMVNTTVVNSTGSVAVYADGDEICTPDGFGGEICSPNGSTLAVRDSTIAGNSAGVGVGPHSTATVARTALHNPAGTNCDSPGYQSGGYNISSDGTCGFSNTGDLQADPRLESLKNYGGYTDTQRPRAGSPAIDHIPRADCVETEDQRGMARPQRGRCDVGAVEVGFCFSGRETRVGDEGDNNLVGTTGADVLIGLEGADTISGREADDRICGSEGADTISGGLGMDRCHGGPGVDAGGAGCETKLSIP
jgi:CSLREA domain-containing protein